MNTSIHRVASSSKQLPVVACENQSMAFIGKAFRPFHIRPDVVSQPLNPTDAYRFEKRAHEEHQRNPLPTESATALVLGSVRAAVAPLTARAVRVELSARLLGPRRASRFLANHSDAALQALSPARLASLGDGLLRLVPKEGASARVAFLRLVRLAEGPLDADRNLRAGRRDDFLCRLRLSPVRYLDIVGQRELVARGAELAAHGGIEGWHSYMDGLTRIAATLGNRIEALLNGQQAYRSFFQAIKSAQSSIHVSVYEFNSDATGWEMAHRLMAAAKGDAFKNRKPVKVRVLYDAQGSKKTDPALFQEMRNAGVEVVCQPSGVLLGHLTHRKIIVIDGKVGFIGGMNVGDAYRYVWHDVHSRVRGPEVAQLQRLFLEQWKAHGGQIQPREEARLFPKLRSHADGVRARVVGHKGLSDRQLKFAFLRAIDSTSKSIEILMPYFADPDIVEHLCEALRRGVSVRLILPRDCDQKHVAQAARAFYADLERAAQTPGAGALEICEYAGAPMTHAKVGIFDGRLTTIGSSNLDFRSLHNNDEANLWIDCKILAAALRTQLFKHDAAQSHLILDHKVTLRERLARKLAPLL